MNVSDAIATRIEIREYAPESIDDGTTRAILDAGRLAPSGKNTQHWSFVLIDDDRRLDELAETSTSGEWVANAAFAVIVVTDPDYYYHEIDAGRTVTHMQFEAWERGVGSCIYTGFDEPAMREAFDIPADLAITLVAGFGYPRRSVESLTGQKDRLPLPEVGHHDRFGNRIDLSG